MTKIQMIKCKKLYRYLQNKDTRTSIQAKFVLVMDGYYICQKYNISNIDVELDIMYFYNNVISEGKI